MATFFCWGSWGPCLIYIQKGEVALLFGAGITSWSLAAAGVSSSWNRQGRRWLMAQSQMQRASLLCCRTTSQCARPIRSVARSTSTMLLPSVRETKRTLAGSAAQGSSDIPLTRSASFALRRLASTPAAFVTCTNMVASRSHFKATRYQESRKDANHAVPFF